MGSGSTAVSCLRTGRNYIGCELDEEYFTKSQDRIKNLPDKLDSFMIL